MWQAVWKTVRMRHRKKAKSKKQSKNKERTPNMAIDRTLLEASPTSPSPHSTPCDYMKNHFWCGSSLNGVNTHTRGGLQGWLKPIAHQKMRCGCGGRGAGGVLNRARTHTPSGWPWRCAAITQFTGRPIESLSVDQYPIKAAHKEREAGRASEQAG